MLYCHDSYGLGHLRRTLTLARYLRARWPAMPQLIVTGSPLAQNFLLPEDADYIKLPSVVKVGPERYAARSLPMSFDEIRDMRTDILLSAARHFRPAALIVDNVPAGLKGEIVPTLRYLKRAPRRTRLILGLRDIVDDGPRVQKTWARDGVYDLLEELYDLIVVYGSRDLYDVIGEYGLSPRAAAKTRYVGYLLRDPAVRSVEQVRTGLNLRTGRLVLVTAGGGGDGYPLFRAALDAYRLTLVAPRFDCLLVGGPLMPEACRRRLTELVPARSTARFVHFVDDLPSYIAAADVVVSMGGYNSVSEILSSRRPAIIVPRVRPRKEQLIRAEVLSRRGLVRMIHPAELTPRRLLEEVDDLLEQSAGPSSPLDLDGLPAVAAELDAILPRRERPSHPAACEAVA